MGLFWPIDILFHLLLHLDRFAAAAHEHENKQLSENKPPAAPQPTAGMRATTRTTLRPTGKILVNGSTHHARSEGPYIDAGIRVEVVRIEGDDLIVRPIPPPLE